MIVIDGLGFDIPVVSLKRTADFLDRYAERTEDGGLHRDLIGVYMNYKLELGTTFDTGEYTRLWDKLTEPVEFHTVTLPGERGDYSFTAYFAGVGDEMLLQKGGSNYFEATTVEFIARLPARS